MIDCACQGREHIVCRKRLALSRPKGRVLSPKCPKHNNWRYATGLEDRHQHTHACRVVALALRIGNRSITPSSHRRVLRMWLSAVQASWKETSC